MVWQHYVRSEQDGADYRVGTWRDGVWVPGTRADAMRELRALDEAHTYVWGKGQR